MTDCMGVAANRGVCDLPDRQMICVILGLVSD
jgi:hypothetical protein